jgi:hypothetical protein
MGEKWASCAARLATFEHSWGYKLDAVMKCAHCDRVVEGADLSPVRA